MMPKQLLYLFTLLLVAFIAACGSQPAAQPTQQPEPTATPSPAPTPTPAIFAWPESDPETQGIDAEILAQIPAYRDEHVEQLNSVLVIRNGELVYETYFGRYDADTYGPVWSVTKSFVSALIGIALDEGQLTSLDQPLSDFYTAAQLADADPRIADVTVRELLTMSSGMWCRNDACHDSPLSKVLSRALEAESGSQFVYDTAATHLLTGVIERATGMPVDAYAEEKLFAPLQFDEVPWERDADQVPFGGKGLILTPRNMAKLGQLYLDEGLWQGERVISAEYVTQSTTTQIETGGDADYGYLWWVGEMGGYDTYAAVGFGGQYVHVVPELDLVTVLTSSYIPARENSAEIIEAVVLPAVVPAQDR